MRNKLENDIKNIINKLKTISEFETSKDKVDCDYLVSQFYNLQDILDLIETTKFTKMDSVINNYKDKANYFINKYKNI